MVSLAGIWRAVLLAIVLLVAGCAAMIEEASRGPAPAPAVGQVSLMPYLSLRDGSLADRLDPGGLPRAPLTGAPVRLVRPVAVGARDGDLYIADAATGQVMRVDAAARLFMPMPGVRAVEGMRLAVGVDRTLHVLDPATRRLQRFSAAGRALAPLSVTTADLAQPADLDIDAQLGTVLVADLLYRQVLAFAPGGGAYTLLPLRGDTQLQLRAVDRIAAGARQLVLSDPQCACLLIAGIQGPLLGRLSLAPLPAVGGLAIDAEGRLYVADNTARELLVLVDGKPIQRISYRSLGISTVGDLRFAAGVLWLADPVGGSVEGRRVFARLAPGSPR